MNAKDKRCARATGTAVGQMHRAKHRTSFWVRAPRIWKRTYVCMANHESLALALNSSQELPGPLCLLHKIHRRCYGHLCPCDCSSSGQSLLHIAASLDQHSKFRPLMPSFWSSVASSRAVSTPDPLWLPSQPPSHTRRSPRYFKNQMGEGSKNYVSTTTTTFLLLLLRFYYYVLLLLLRFYRALLPILHIIIRL